MKKRDLKRWVKESNKTRDLMKKSYEESRKAALEFIEHEICSVGEWLDEDYLNALQLVEDRIIDDIAIEVTS